MYKWVPCVLNFSTSKETEYQKCIYIVLSYDSGLPLQKESYPLTHLYTPHPREPETGVKLS